MLNWPAIIYRSRYGINTEVQVNLEISIPFDREGFDFPVYDLIVQGKDHQILSWVRHCSSLIFILF